MQFSLNDIRSQTIRQLGLISENHCMIVINSDKESRHVTEP